MRSLIKYLLRNHFFLLFILLEILSFTFIFTYNDYQKSKYLNSANAITGTVYYSFNSVVSYFQLRGVNNELSRENAILKNTLFRQDSTRTGKDSILPYQPLADMPYRFIPARVINNSVNKRSNYITLNKGRKHGIMPDQGIINSSGVVGVITNVSESYSMGLSVLNQQWGVSAKLKNSGFFGSISWEGDDYRMANLNEIPFHVKLNRGDTIVTSSYSLLFPEGIMIGTIESYEQPEGENYYQIKVKLSTNFKSLAYVDVVEVVNKDEINTLRNVTEEDEITD